MFNNQGTSKPEAFQKENGDMAWAGCEELVELDDVQLATVVGGRKVWAGGGLYEGQIVVKIYDVDPLDLLPLEYWTNNLKKKEEEGEEILQ